VSLLFVSLFKFENELLLINCLFSLLELFAVAEVRLVWVIRLEADDVDLSSFFSFALK
jgi:hypothetical protein